MPRLSPVTGYLLNLPITTQTREFMPHTTINPGGAAPPRTPFHPTAAQVEAMVRALEPPAPGYPPVGPVQSGEFDLRLPGSQRITGPTTTEVNLLRAIWLARKLWFVAKRSPWVAAGSLILEGAYENREDITDALDSALTLITGGRTARQAALAREREAAEVTADLNTLVVPPSDVPLPGETEGDAIDRRKRELRERARLRDGPQGPQFLPNMPLEEDNSRRQRMRDNPWFDP